MCRTQSYLALVGTYPDTHSEGVYSYRIDNVTGELEQLAATPAGEAPSFLTVDSSNRYLYVVDEIEDGAVTAFEIERETGKLTELNRQSSSGSGPCYCSVDDTDSYVLVAHYTQGSVAMLPIKQDGRLGEVADKVKHEGTSIDQNRQTRPHAHSIMSGPDNRFAYAPDLGADRVFVYEMDLERGQLRPAENPYVKVHKGAGPRHLDFHPNGQFVYLINEIDSTVTTFERNRDAGSLSVIETMSTLPEGFNGENTAADIHVHPSGESVYASNRGHDSIAIFTIDAATGCPRPIDHVSTQGKSPRNFALDPEGEYLFAENQHTNNIVTFQTSAETNELITTEYETEVPRPVCMNIIPNG